MTDKSHSIAYFGIPGSFTHAAALAYFGDLAKLKSAKTFRDTFLMVQNGEAERGVLPIENTLAGSVYDNYDLLDEYYVTIVGEISEKVEHSFLVGDTVASAIQDDFRGLTAVYSHPKALEQCSIFLDQHPWIERCAYSDTATAAQFVAEQQDSHIAAIAGRHNTSTYALKSLQENLENNSYNFTRFLVIGPENTPTPQGANKCSLAVRLPHITGSLSLALSFLTERGCNLTKIESRPLQDKPFEYVFYLDFLFGADHDIAATIAAFSQQVPSLRVLGIYQDERTAILK